MNRQSFLFVLCSIVLIHRVYNHKCNHDKHKHRVKHKITHRSQLIKDPAVEGRRLESGWRKMDILYDFSNIQGIDESYRKFLQDTIFPEIKLYMESLLTINEEKKTRYFADNCQIQEARIDSKYETEGTDADLTIVVGTESNNGGGLAFASHCANDQSTGRPIAGVVVVNINQIKLTKENVRFTFEDVFHEIVHVLGFNSTLYDLFQNQPAYKIETQNLDGQSYQRYKMITPKLVSMARDYFNCDSIDGVYLENQGNESSAASHFETIHFGQEVMTPTRESFGLISKFTFALLEDTGWYNVDYSKADKFTFGKNAGCDFFKSTTCNQNVDELCTSEGQIKCSRDYTTKTYCETTSFSDGCIWSVPIYEQYCLNSLSFQSNSLKEKNGINSRCYETVSSGTEAAGCYESRCSGDQLKVTIEGQEFECTEKGKKISVSENLEIICPDIEKFCGYLNDQCKDDCNANGFCGENNTCQCLYFYKGDTCGENKTCDSGSNTFSCEATQYPDFADLNLLYTNIIFSILFVFNL